MTDKDYKKSDDENVEQLEESLEEKREIHDEQEAIQDEQASVFDDEDDIEEDKPIVEKSTPSRVSRGWMFASIVLLAALIYVVIQPPFNKSDDESIATVNGVAITKDMLYDQMVGTGGASLLENMIIEELLDQEAKETGVEVTTADIDSEIAMYRIEYPTDEAWEAILSQIGTTEQQLREDVVMNIQMRKLLEPQTPVTDEEITAFYNENLEAMTTEDKVPTLEEKKEEIRYQLVYQKVSELFPAYVEEVRAKADITNSLAEAVQ